jgi:hypothetical protein
MSLADRILDKNRVDEAVKNKIQATSAINQLLDFMKINDEKFEDYKNEFTEIKDSLLDLRRIIQKEF